MRIAVAGMWHLGTVTAACLADAGYRVLGYDQSPDTVALLQNGKLPVNEPGLSELMHSVIEQGLLSFTINPAEIANYDILWIAYDTPVDNEDLADTGFVVHSIESLFPFLKDGHLVIISSQVPVGTTSRLEKQLRNTRPSLSASFACLPENLQLGKAIEIFTNPDRVVAGVRTKKDKTRIARLLAPFTDNIIWMSFESAEMTKHAINAFLATSVSFINEMARICELVKADAAEVEQGLKSDSRIGQHAYLRPGPAFAGGTLARDLMHLLSLGRKKEIELPLLRGGIESNDLQKSWPRKKLLDVLGGFQGQKIALLGLTYKPGTDTLRRSESVELGRWLKSKGARVAAYDPAVKVLPNELENVLKLSKTLGPVLEGAHAVVVATPWPEFKRLKADKIVAKMERPVVIDPGGFLSDVFEKDPRILYLKVGKSYETHR